MLEKLTKARPIELQVWMWSAGIIGLGLGLYLANYIKQHALWILVLGLAVHIAAMYKIYSRGA